MEKSPLPVKGSKFWPMLGTHGYWAVRVLKRANLLWHSHKQWSYHYLFYEFGQVKRDLYKFITQSKKTLQLRMYGYCSVLII